MKSDKIYFAIGFPFAAIAVTLIGLAYPFIWISKKFKHSYWQW